VQLGSNAALLMLGMNAGHWQKMSSCFHCFNPGDRQFGEAVRQMTASTIPPGTNCGGAHRPGYSLRTRADWNTRPPTAGFNSNHDLLVEKCRRW